MLKFSFSASNEIFLIDSELMKDAFSKEYLFTHHILMEECGLIQMNPGYSINSDNDLSLIYGPYVALIKKMEGEDKANFNLDATSMLTTSGKELYNLLKISNLIPYDVEVMKLYLKQYSQRNSRKVSLHVLDRVDGLDIHYSPDNLLTINDGSVNPP